MTRALRLHDKHSKAVLIAKLDALREAPESQARDVLPLLTPKAQRLMDDLLLAIYWHDAPQGNTRMQRAKPTEKWW